MDLDFYHITIKPVGLNGAASANYTREVHEHLTWIHRTKSGRLLLNCIRRPEFPIEIRPHPIHECNAVGGGERKTPGANLTGVVTYTPGEFTEHGACGIRAENQKRGMIWDEILFHELIHVFRNATGKWDNAPKLSFAMRQYDSNEEFLAVLCTNIYVSDRTNKIKSGLRAGHQDFSAMSVEDAKRFGLFLSSRAAFRLVKKFCTENPIFTKALADQLGDVEYNPIADFYKYPELCEALSIAGAFNDYNKVYAALTNMGLKADIASKIAMFNLTP